MEGWYRLRRRCRDVTAEGPHLDVGFTHRGLERRSGGSSEVMPPARVLRCKKWIALGAGGAGKGVARAAPLHAAPGDEHGLWGIIRLFAHTIPEFSERQRVTKNASLDYLILPSYTSINTSSTPYMGQISN